MFSLIQLDLLDKNSSMEEKKKVNVCICTFEAMFQRFWCSLVKAKGPLISMELLLLFFVSNHNFDCTKENHRLAQLGFNS